MLVSYIINDTIERRHRFCVIAVRRGSGALQIGGEMINYTLCVSLKGRFVVVFAITIISMRTELIRTRDGGHKCLVVCAIWVHTLLEVFDVFFFVAAIMSSC